jgi:hypothetical protein
MKLMARRSLELVPIWELTAESLNGHADPNNDLFLLAAPALVSILLVWM